MCTFVLCHKTLDTVAAIHFCMVILRPTSYSGHQGTSLSRFSILGILLGELSPIEVYLAPFCRTSEEYVVAVKGISISIALSILPLF